MLRITLSLFLIASLTSACGDGERRRIGDTCDSATQCESGICIQNLCVAPLGSTCETGSQCESGLCLDGICTTESIDAQPARFFFINPGFAVEDHGGQSTLIPRQVYSDAFLIAEDGIGPGTECVADAFVRRLAGGAVNIETLHFCDLVSDDSEERIPFTHTAGRISLSLPEETSENPLGYTETQRPMTVDLYAADASVHPANADLLVGQFLRDYAVHHPNDAGSTEGREINLVTAIRLSDSATTADLDGDWGFVYLNTEAARDARQINHESGYFAASIESGSVDLGTGRSYRATQGSSEGLQLDFETYDRDEEASIPLQVQPNGRVIVGGSDSALAGAVNTTRDFLALTSSNPPNWPPLPNDDVVIVEDVEYIEYETIIAVRRASDPLSALTGHTYQVIRQGWLSSLEGFGVVLNRDTTTLTFSADGSRVTLDGDDTILRVGFQGGLTTSDEAIELPEVDVTVEAATSAFRLMDPSGDNVLASGFARVDGRILVLIDPHAGGDVAVTSTQLGLSIGVCQTCN